MAKQLTDYNPEQDTSVIAIEASDENILVEYLNYSQEPSEKFPAEPTEVLEKTFQGFTPYKLLEILKRTQTGKDILRRAKHTELSEASQLKLAEIVAKHHISLGKKTTAEDLEKYSLAIVTLFKLERKEN
ncbi:uncharacterized protein LOC129718515 [Wyeomyia smithii]|uniref:uncharacterized protein LOC129718515 n=1 Tax=Wyeomyia smithii TaxID=174621 RepID=UPI0024681EC0|nr:uncharacterized protein LOC129718515 [Wyeomyia smithii]